MVMSLVQSGSAGKPVADGAAGEGPFLREHQMAPLEGWRVGRV